MARGTGPERSPRRGALRRRAELPGAVRGLGCSEHQLPTKAPLPSDPAQQSGPLHRPPVRWGRGPLLHWGAGASHLQCAGIGLTRVTPLFPQGRAGQAWARGTTCGEVNGDLCIINTGPWWERQPRPQCLLLPEVFFFSGALVQICLIYESSPVRKQTQRTECQGSLPEESTSSPLPPPPHPRGFFCILSLSRART